MSRTKGSKNKTRVEQPKEEPVHLESKSGFLPPTPSSPSPVEWKPAPEMGKIKPPEDAEKRCECLHKGGLHYGGPKGWCNFGGCNCQEFVQGKPPKIATLDQF